MKKIISNLITPFTNENEVDYNLMSKIIKMSEKNCVNGFSLFSITGEGTNLKEEEKRKIYYFVKENTNLKVVINIYSLDKNSILEEICKYEKKDIIYLHYPSVYSSRKLDIVSFYSFVLSKNPSYSFYLECIDFLPSDISSLLKYKNVKGIVIDKYYNYSEEINKKIIINNDNEITKCIENNIKCYITNIGFVFGKILSEMIEDWEYGFKNKLLFSYFDLACEVFSELPCPLNIKYYLSLNSNQSILNLRVPQYLKDIGNCHFDLLLQNDS